MPILGDVRLTGFDGSNARGMVEFYRGSVTGWVTVCSDFWDSMDANVTCVQLGYESGIEEVVDISPL